MAAGQLVPGTAGRKKWRGGLSTGAAYPVRAARRAGPADHGAGAGLVAGRGKEAGPERGYFLERAQEGQVLTEQELSLLDPSDRSCIDRAVGHALPGAGASRDADELRCEPEWRRSLLPCVCLLPQTHRAFGTPAGWSRLCAGTRRASTRRWMTTRARYRAQVCRLARQEGVERRNGRAHTHSGRHRAAGGNAM